MESLSGFSEEITLKIQTLDSQYPVTVKRQNTISELKEKLCEVNKKNLFRFSIFQVKI